MGGCMNCHFQGTYTFIRIDRLIQSCEELKKKQGQGESGVVRVI